MRKHRVWSIVEIDQVGYTGKVYCMYRATMNKCVSIDLMRVLPSAHSGLLLDYNVIVYTVHIHQITGDTYLAVNLEYFK